MAKVRRVKDGLELSVRKAGCCDEKGARLVVGLMTGLRLIDPLMSPIQGKRYSTNKPSAVPENLLVLQARLSILSS